jgi:hypothetical protein
MPCSLSTLSTCARRLRAEEGREQVGGDAIESAPLR